MLTASVPSASTATIIRVPYVWQLTHDSDFLYVFTDFTIWSTVENGVGLAASSIATMRPLLKKVRDLTMFTAVFKRRHHDLSLATPQSSRPGSSARVRSWWDQFQYDDVPPMTPMTATYSSGCKSRADMERLAVAPWERDERPTGTGPSCRVTVDRGRW